MLVGHNATPPAMGRSAIQGAAPRLIEYNGYHLGIAVPHELGVRFIADDDRVTDMDQSVWPTVEYAEDSARQLFRASGRKV